MFSLLSLHALLGRLLWLLHNLRQLLLEDNALAAQSLALSLHVLRHLEFDNWEGKELCDRGTVFRILRQQLVNQAAQLRAVWELGVHRWGVLRHNLEH